MRAIWNPIGKKHIKYIFNHSKLHVLGHELLDTEL